MGSSQGVADTLARIEIGVENLALFCRRDFCEGFSGRVGERAADANDRLRSFGRIDEDADLGLQRLTHPLERQSVGSGEAVIRVVGGGVDRDLSSLHRTNIGRLWVLSRQLISRQRKPGFSQRKRRGGRYE